MSRHEAPRFRITAWPGHALPEPGVLAVEHVDQCGEWFGLRLGSSHVAIPREAYLREVRDADANSLDDLRKLATMGIWRPLADGAGARDLAISDEKQLSNTLTRFHAEARSSMPPDDYDREPAYQLFEGCLPVHADEIAIRVRVLQMAVDHVEAYHAGRPLAPAWRDCETDAEAWEQFSRWSTAALRDFHVRVIVEAEGNEDPEMRRGDVYTTVYGVAWLQLVNDLAEGLPMRVCANESCGRSFVRQLGRSVYGQSRTEGIRYCSADCARAQAQREYRRRKRKAEKQ